MRSTGRTTAPEGATPTKRAPREGSKQARAIEMMKRDGGATAEEIGTAMSWQRHTVRGFIAGAIKKKLGIAVTAAKVEGGGTVYSIAADA